MKIVTWNCNGGFAKKAHRLFELAPDVAVVQECSEASTQIQTDGYRGLWLGGDSRRGLGLFCKRDWTARVLSPAKYKWVVPVEIVGERRFTLAAVWACAIKGNHKDSYVGQLHLLLASKPEWLMGGGAIVAGDFNSNAIFDKGRRLANHSTMVRELKAHGLVSAYHESTGVEHGEEADPTFHLYRHPSKAFHFDYVFVPAPWLDRARVSVGKHAEWAEWSDHNPVSVEID